MSAPDEGKRKGLTMIDLGRGVAASPERATEIIDERRRNRATQQEQKEHPKKLKHSSVRAYMLGKNSGLTEDKYEPDKKRKEHIEKRMADSKRKKPAENQK